MARPGVEYDDVARVAKQLMSQGEFPSVQKVRLRLGTGSNTTISNHLRAWQANLAATKISPALPESVPEDLMNPLDEFWSLALAKAEANYQKFKEEMEAKVVAAETAQQEAQSALAQQRTEFEDLQQAHAQLEMQLRETENKWHTLQGEQTITASELNQAHATLDQAHALLQSQQQTFETERAQLMTALSADNQHLEQALQQRQQQYDDLKQQLQTVQRQFSKSLETVEALRQALEQSKAREITLSELNGQYQGKIAQLQPKT